MKEWFKKQIDKYLGRARLLNPALLFSGILLATEFLIWRLKLQTPISEAFFLFPAALGGSTGYYLAKQSKSKPLLAVAALVSVLSITAYKYSIEVIADASLSTVLFLVLLFCVGFCALFMAIRIMMNLGLH